MSDQCGNCKGRKQPKSSCGTERRCSDEQQEGVRQKRNDRCQQEGREGKGHREYDM